MSNSIPKVAPYQLGAYYVAPGKNGGEIVFPGPLENWPDQCRQNPPGTTDELEYYGGFLLAESIRVSDIRKRMVAAWNCTRNVPLELLRNDQYLKTLDLLHFLRSVIVNGGGPSMKAAAVDRIDAVFSNL